MGCVLGESQGREGAHRTSSTLKRDVSRVRTGVKLGEGQGLVLGGGVKRKMTRWICYTHSIVMSSLLFEWRAESIQTGRHTEKHTSTLKHSQNSIHMYTC